MDYKEALANPLILHQIFKNLPNKFLLSSCSLVNKCWNRQARTFIRDYRKCKARSPTDGNDSTFIQELDQICCRMTEEGRVIPFNSVRISLDPTSCLTDHRSSEDQIVLVSQLKLKFLEVDWKFAYHTADCFVVHKALQAVLRKNAHDLRSMHFVTFPPCLNIFLGDWSNGFSKLEKLTLSRLFDPDFNSAQKAVQIQLLQRILGSCPNLRRIAVEDFESLVILPIEKFKLLEKLELCLHEITGQNLFRAVAKLVSKAKPSLRKLRIDFHPVLSRRMLGGNFRRAVYTALELLLQSCHSTLEKLSISSHVPLSQLSLPSLSKLKKLELGNVSGLSSHQCTNMVDIDYEQIMPKLEEVKIKSSGFEEFSLRWHYAAEVQQSVERGSATNVWKLTLELNPKKIRWHFINRLFPNVLTWEIQVMEVYSTADNDFLPLKEIFLCWTYLRQLKITDVANFAPKCHDDDFCGINNEEAVLLREQDEEFLKAVHIVPIRPCVLTMPNLRELGIDFGVRSNAAPPEFAIPFISKVTELIAFQRMPQLGVTIVGSFSE